MDGRACVGSLTYCRARIHCLCKPCITPSLRDSHSYLLELSIPDWPHTRRGLLRPQSPTGIRDSSRTLSLIGVFCTENTKRIDNGIEVRFSLICYSIHTVTNIVSQQMSRPNHASTDANTRISVGLFLILGNATN